MTAWTCVPPDWGRATATERWRLIFMLHIPPGTSCCPFPLRFPLLVRGPAARAGGPSLLVRHLLAAGTDPLAHPGRVAEGLGATGHVPGDHRAGAHVGAVAQGKRRDQDAVAADEHALADGGAVLARAVVVAGDGAGADVAVPANVGVAQVAQVAGLDAGPGARVLELDEVAHVVAGTDDRARPDVGEWPD